jgi:hypothetical protein
MRMKRRMKMKMSEDESEDDKGEEGEEVEVCEDKRYSCRHVESMNGCILKRYTDEGNRRRHERSHYWAKTCSVWCKQCQRIGEKVTGVRKGEKQKCREKVRELTYFLNSQSISSTIAQIILAHPIESSLGGIILALQESPSIEKKLSHYLQLPTPLQKKIQERKKEDRELVRKSMLELHLNLDSTHEQVEKIENYLMLGFTVGQFRYWKDKFVTSNFSITQSPSKRGYIADLEDGIESMFKGNNWGGI